MATNGCPSFRHTVMLGGLMVGVLDGLDAVIFYRLADGVPPGALFQNIARALIGPRAFAGGGATVLLGVSLHFLISFAAATGYYAAARRFPALLRRPLLWGTVYGLLWYGFMYRVVIPLSALPPRPPGIDWPAVIDEVFAHIVLVGLPVALLASRSWRAGQSRVAE